MLSNNRYRSLTMAASPLTSRHPTAMFMCESNAASMEQIFDDDHTATILSIDYSQFEGDPRKFHIVCLTDPTKFVIINTHVDDGGVIHTWQAKYDETL